MPYIPNPSNWINGLFMNMLAQPSDWIKPAISLALNQRTGQDLSVSVGNVPYGAWLWDELTKTHVHASREYLKQTIGYRDVANIYRNLTPVSLTWDDVKYAHSKIRDAR